MDMVSICTPSLHTVYNITMLSVTGGTLQTSSNIIFVPGGESSVQAYNLSSVVQSLGMKHALSTSFIKRLYTCTQARLEVKTEGSGRIKVAYATCFLSASYGLHDDRL